MTTSEPKRIAVVLGMYTDIPSRKDPAASVQHSGMESAMALARHKNVDITVYAPAASTLITYAAEVAKKHGVDSEIVEGGKAVRFKGGGVLRLHAALETETYGQAVNGEAYGQRAEAEATEEFGRILSAVQAEETGLKLLQEQEDWAHYALEEAKETGLHASLRADHEKKPFDVIHLHLWNHGIFDTMVMEQMTPEMREKMIITSHGLHASPHFPEYNPTMIALSEPHAAYLRGQNGVKAVHTVPHGVDDAKYTATQKSAGYLCYLGRMSADKGALRAILAAKEARKPLIMAGNVTDWEHGYYEKVLTEHITCVDEGFLNKHQTPEALRAAIRTLPGAPPIVFVGKVNEEQKQILLGNAFATLCPPSFPEAFYLMAVESIACGSPVIGIERFGDKICSSVIADIAKAGGGISISVPSAATAEEMDHTAAAQMAEAVKRLDARMASSEGEAAVRTVTRRSFEKLYTPKQHADAMDGVYESFLVKHTKKNKRVAVLSGMYDTLPPIHNQAAALQHAIADSAIFTAGTQNTDVTVYAPESSPLIEVAVRTAEKMKWGYELSADGMAVTFFHGDEQKGTLRLQGPENILPWEIEWENPSVEEREAMLRHMLIDDYKREAYDVIHTHYLDPGGIAPLLDDPEFDDEMKARHMTTAHTCGSENRTFLNWQIPTIAVSQLAANLFKKQGANLLHMVHHGVNEALYTATEKSAGYLAVIGRMDDQKGIHEAIATAKKLKKPLVIVSRVESGHEPAYFKEKVKPYLTHNFNGAETHFFDQYKDRESLERAIGQLEGDPPIVFVGGVNQEQRQIMYENAQALLWPINGLESFGLVVAEAMACGTPVIGVRSRAGTILNSVIELVAQRGAGVALDVPEAMPENAESSVVDLAIEAFRKLEDQDEQALRKLARQVFEENFSLTAHAGALNNAYDKMAERGRGPSWVGTVVSRKTPSPSLGLGA